MTNGQLEIWTVGHSTRTIEDFLALLLQNRIEVLVDVRHFPVSRHVPHFNRDPLAASLAGAGIRYEHMVALGGRRPARPDSHNLAWRNISFRGYADYMETRPFRDSIDRLMKIVATSRTAIMCSESLWWRCHRSMIADYLKAAGMRVCHIMGPNKVEDHPYTTAARLMNGRLSYRIDGPSKSLFAPDD